MNDQRVLGLDNSTRSTGWAVVDVINGEPRLVANGLIKRGRSKDDVAKFLIDFETKVEQILNEYSPEVIAAEQMFVGGNRTTAMHLAYVHGVMLLVAGKHEVPVVYYQPMTAKSVVLDGLTLKRADGQWKKGKELKLEVQRKVYEILGERAFTGEVTDDVTDAASMALTYWRLDGHEAEGGKRRKR